MVYITFLYCHSCTRATVEQENKAIPYDCETRRPCIGSCGHSICEICVTDRSDKSCPICHQENSFKTKTINYFALPIIEDYQNKAWENMKGLWRGSGLNTSLCSGCSSETELTSLRICHDCTRDMDYSWNFNEFCSNYVEIQTRALCEDCLQTHHHGHHFSRIMALSAPQHNIKKTTADVIYALFENWMEKTPGFINCELRRARIYYNCGLLENQALGMPRGKCGWFRAKIKAEINKNLIENIEKQVENWRNGEGPNPDETLRNSKCECVRIYEELKELGYEQDISNCYQKLLKGERKKRTGIMISDIQGCPLYFDFNQKRRDKLSDWGYQNFDEIILSRWTDVTLDDLLVMNSKEINIRSARVIDEKILNRFIKHWIAGSNKRMKYLGLATQNRITIDRAAVLKGIRHVLVPKECRRFFKDTPSLKHSIEGGYDFKRKDGTTGTIVFDRFEYFQLFVWP
ncbi:hypothetical protein GCK72_007135 [Caenorhabditis remanei]|uniref:RING-type domain-containing protein n=1 Tax=Caenorhabditis remanei TaxID=31234 RepID=A0A6A5HKG0_CAERE|nr:hypothetical protein GCK72_007135 [Caenorhabditis remanei]KAF1767176.1 hypothetical protein GCK72_007135 [Caenorhabditis remanei]